MEAAVPWVSPGIATLRRHTGNGRLKNQQHVLHHSEAHRDVESSMTCPARRTLVTTLSPDSSVLILA